MGCFIKMYKLLTCEFFKWVDEESSIEGDHIRTLTRYDSCAEDAKENTWVWERSEETEDDLWHFNCYYSYHKL